ncbi:phosphoglycerate mutase-like protein [Aulographum hederae CBS 113979]|uniref:Phosphoglycerate mutase-like protein n=1 Tax=Aulographum hederae CBS 113979 TaxID=1176131 RepID=A0A6G1GP43_9PEZI|nr:phosphoglycerate mutase-like protein [Aulographum hederae CBS 113979]
MGKPRMIILVRHAQSEGNKNRDIHQFIPDHRVKLTPDGQQQAEEAGRRLRSMLRPDDTLQFFTSPYRRTRETTEGILKSLTSDEPTPSPYPRHTIKVWEEPRLREQDFGNFQPCSVEMERMWQERADYGHFFYRIPNGESAADAYDRVSGFNESLWRSFSENDFPSVCVLVTHGLMSRVFLMKWYHWSVEYFEDLRNVNHCEFIVMKRREDNGKFILQNQLRTWSDLKKRAAATGAPAKSLPDPTAASNVPIRRWGGCANGCDHDKVNFPRRTKRQNTNDFQSNPPVAKAIAEAEKKEKEKEDSPLAAHDASSSLSAMPPTSNPTKPPPRAGSVTTSTSQEPSILTPPSSTTTAVIRSDDSNDASEEDDEAFPHQHHISPNKPKKTRPNLLSVRGRDGGGSQSGMGTPFAGNSDDSDFFSPPPQSMKDLRDSKGQGLPIRTRGAASSASKKIQAIQSGATTTAEDKGNWAQESGMGSGAYADRLGDNRPCEDGESGGGGYEKRRGDGRIEEEDEMSHDEGRDGVVQGGRVVAKGPQILDEVVDKMKERDRKSFREVY